ncbi:hypothetical protein BaRGS_00038430 [Batillaria attramentaria]|uniref:Tetraspanin n=1 Tax=Batillaria attramentaria TaxID=370345 RepID=A0ABD0J658_9CAEN
MDCRRLAFCVLNVLLTVVSLAALVLGGLVTANPNYVATILATGSNTVSSLSGDTREDFQIFELNIADIEMYRRAGICLIVVGISVFGTALPGWVTWWFLRKPSVTAVKMLFFYIVLLTVLATVQIGLIGDFLDWYSKIPDRMREYYETHTLENNYNESGPGDFSLNVNLLHYVYDCCGIFGQSDFMNSPTGLPPSCCKQSIISGDDSTKKLDCMSGGARDDYYSQQAELKVLKNLTTIGAIAAVILLLQAVQVIIGVLFLRDPERVRVAPKLLPATNVHETPATSVKQKPVVTSSVSALPPIRTPRTPRLTSDVTHPIQTARTSGTSFSSSR